MRNLDIEIGEVEETKDKAIIRLNDTTSIHAMIIGDHGTGTVTTMNIALLSLLRNTKAEDVDIWLNKEEFALDAVIRNLDAENLTRVLSVEQSAYNRLFDIASIRLHTLAVAGCKTYVFYNKKNPEHVMKPIVLFDYDLNGSVTEGRGDIETILKLGRTVGIHIIGRYESGNSRNIGTMLDGCFNSKVVLKCSDSMSRQLILSEDASHLKESDREAFLWYERMVEVGVESDDETIPIGVAPKRFLCKVKLNSGIDDRL